MGGRRREIRVLTASANCPIAGPKHRAPRVNTFLVIAVYVLLGATAACACDVMVVQGLRVKPYDEALRGFRCACGAQVKRFFLTDLEGMDVVRKVREEKPRLLFVIGGDALKKVRAIRDVPVVYVMVVDPQSIVRGGENITGVAMGVPPEKYLDLLALISPPPRVVGLIYNPATTGHLMKRVQQAARARGVVLQAREVHSSREVPAALDRLKGVIDSFWMLPDTTVVTPETVELLLLFSQKNRVPVISFAAKYVVMGALAALDIDGFDQGKQAGEMATSLLNGTPLAELPASDSRRAVVRTNMSVAKKLGITLKGSAGLGFPDR